MGSGILVIFIVKIMGLWGGGGGVDRKILVKMCVIKECLDFFSIKY